MSIVSLAEELAALDVDAADGDECGRVLVLAGRLRSVVDGFETRAMTRLRSLAALDRSVVPELVMSGAGPRSGREQQALERRAATAEQLPEFAAALGTGGVTGAHLDAVGAAVRRLEPAQRDSLTGAGERLVDAASRMGPDEFGRWLDREVRTIEASSGIDRLERQRRANRFRTWHHRETGMLHGSFQLDPESGLAVLGALRATVEALFHDATPESSPADPLEKQDHLRALAFIDMVTCPRSANADGGDRNGRRGSGNGRQAEIIVVVDERTLLEGVHGETRMSTGTDLELSRATLRRWLCTEVFIPALVDADGVVTDLGRKQRLASGDQRRMLRAMYDRCAIDGCTVPFTNCTVHHLDEWTADHGPTDLANLLPLCSRHHHAVHERGWHIELGPQRELTIRYPDGTETRAALRPAEADHQHQRSA